MQQGVRKLHHRDQSLPFRVRGETGLLSRGGELAVSRICQTPNCIYTTQTLSIIGRVGNKGGVCPPSLFPLPQKYIWYVIGPCNPCMSLSLDRCEPRFVFAKKSHSRRHQDARQGSEMAHFFRLRRLACRGNHPRALHLAQGVASSKIHVLRLQTCGRVDGVPDTT